MKLQLSPGFGFGFALVHDNNNDVFIPELWANESIAILVENMVAGNLVYRDFENVLQKYGDVVNVPKPHALTAKRKMLTDNVVIQDVVADDVRVPLDQHIHTSFLIRDGEESKSFKSLIDEYLRPAIIGQASFIDKVVLGQYIQFMANSYGTLGGLTSANAKAAILGTRQVMNINKCPANGRNLVLNPLSETVCLSLDIFTAANQVGDDGTALREASLGRKLGFDFFMDQNMAMVGIGGATTATGAINNAAGYVAGTTVLTVSGFTGIVATGSTVQIAGDTGLHTVTAHTETLGATTQITISPPLNNNVANAAAVNTSTSATGGTVSNASGYAIGYAKEITLAGLTKPPQVGQSISFAAQTNKYVIVNVNGLVGVTLDRPLDLALNNADAVVLGPPGNYNFAFHRNAIALVVRPLAMPRQGAGALSAVANWNNLSMRVVITYDGNAQGHLVTVDMLAGIAILDVALGAVMLG